jgi:hypothetical protein
MGGEDGYFYQQFDLNVSTKLVKCYILSVALYGAQGWTFRKVDQKYLESFEMWCWGRMEKVSWTDRVRNEGVLRSVKIERNNIHTIKKQEG